MISVIGNFRAGYEINRNGSPGTEVMRMRSYIESNLIVPICSVIHSCGRFGFTRSVIEFQSISLTGCKMRRVYIEISRITRRFIEVCVSDHHYGRTVFLFRNICVIFIEITFGICPRERTVSNILHGFSVIVRTDHFKFVDKNICVACTIGKVHFHPLNIGLTLLSCETISICLPFAGRSDSNISLVCIPGSISCRIHIVDTNGKSARISGFILKGKRIALIVGQHSEIVAEIFTRIEFERSAVVVGRFARNLSRCKSFCGTISHRKLPIIIRSTKRLQTEFYSVDSRVGRFNGDIVHIEIAYAFRAYFKNNRFRGNGCFIRESRFGPVVSSSVNRMKNGVFVVHDVSVRALFLNFKVNPVSGCLRANALYKRADNVVLIGSYVERVGIHNKFPVGFFSFQMQSIARSAFRRCENVEIIGLIRETALFSVGVSVVVEIILPARQRFVFTLDFYGFRFKALGNNDLILCRADGGSCRRYR